MRESLEHIDQRRTGLPEFGALDDELTLRRSLGSLATAQEAVAGVGDGLADTISTLVGGPTLRFAGVGIDAASTERPIPREVWQNLNHFILAA